MFDIERFHNELAMRLGYERVVKDKEILITVEESDDPVVTLKVHGHEDICFKASDDTEYVELNNKNEIKGIVDAVYQAYKAANIILFELR